jgi:RND superfamily putative drug exporter
MLTTLTRFVVRGRVALLVVFLALFAVAGAYGAGAPHVLQLGGLEDQERESFRAMRLLKQEFRIGNPDVIVVFRGAHALPDEEGFRTRVQAVLDHLAAADGVLSVSSVTGSAPDALVSSDGRVVVAKVSLDGTDTEKYATYRRIEPQIRAYGDDVLLGGTVAAGIEAQRVVEQDLHRAELVTLPLLAVLLFLFFRSVMAAILPLTVGGFAIVSTLALLRVLSGAMEVSIFALNLVTIIGLGVAVDYSLFMVRRFRDELDAGRPVELAVQETLRTAGRTIAFSGIAVAASLIGLLVIPIMLLRSISIGGTLVVLVAMGSALIFLPAMLALLGRRVDWLSISRRRPTAVGTGFWHRLSVLVMRFPVLITTVVAAALLLLGVPFLRLETSVTDLRNMLPHSEVRRVQELLQTPGMFPPNELTPILVAIELEDPVVSRGGIEALSSYVSAIEGMDGVRRVDSVASREHRDRLRSASGGGLASLANIPRENLDRLRRVVHGGFTVVSIVTHAPPTSREAIRLVEDIRRLEIRHGSALVGGMSARLVDLRASVSDGLPFVLVVVCTATFLTLFLAFGSIVIPLKATVMNALSLSASFGALVWVFQDGRFERLLQYTATGQIELTIPVVMFAVVFGLSMDYELFLLSRIREEYDRTGDTVQSVALGLERTARVITSAAALLVTVMLGFMTAELLLAKELALGIALAITMDATIVRALLVPATMQLLGRLNWWAPAPLERLWKAVGLGLDESEAPASPSSSPPTT